MNLLASLLPGVRELRAPFTAGVLWIAALYFLIPNAVAAFIATPATKVAIESLGGSSVVAAAVLAGLAYLVGVAMGGVTGPVTGLLGAWLLRFGVWVGTKRTYITPDGRYAPLRRPRWFFEIVRRMELHVWPLTISGRSLLIDSLQARLSKAGVPGSASMMFPLYNVVANLRFTAAQLSSTLPAQYQEYDRLRGEVDFRVSVAPALIALAAVIPIGPRWAVLGGATFIALMLWIQAGRAARAANDLLGNAAYLDQLKVPAIESLASELEKASPKPSSSGAWIAAMIMALDRLGMYEDSEWLLMEASYLDSEVDQQEVLEALPESSHQRTNLATAAARYAGGKSN